MNVHSPKSLFRQKTQDGLYTNCFPVLKKKITIQSWMTYKLGGDEKHSIVNI